MSDYQKVTEYYKEVLPKIKGHYWEVSVKDHKEDVFKTSDYTLSVMLWTKVRTGITVSVFLRVNKDTPRASVLARVSTIATQVVLLLEITPAPAKGFYLCHNNWSVGDSNEWETELRRRDYKDFTKRSCKYNILREDFEDLEYKFKELMAQATTARGLPSFVTGMK
jgi:hypothetical protein